MGMFTQYQEALKNAKVSGGRGIDLNPGNYVLEITECKGIQTRSKGTAFEVWGKVLSADATEPGIKPNEVGSSWSDFCLLSDDIGASRAKALVLTLTGLDPVSASDAALIAEQPIAELMEAGVAGAFNKRKLLCMVATTAVKNLKPNGRSTYPRRNYRPDPEVRATLLAALR